ncbi:hypothetical protein RRF57_002561 [Xylaria bambusicola]|uniref:Uncharacterized protein n=1 Tax=Xylaria bambusicola TaxID=326684 RepID=A0AAN7UFG8_9PEZI
MTSLMVVAPPSVALSAASSVPSVGTVDITVNREGALLYRDGNSAVVNFFFQLTGLSSLDS